MSVQNALSETESLVKSGYERSTADKIECHDCGHPVDPQYATLKNDFWVCESCSR